jgi:hypothetical protein
MAAITLDFKKPHVLRNAREYKTLIEYASSFQREPSRDNA